MSLAEPAYVSRLRVYSLYYSTKSTGTEDCLYLNVYSPDIPVTENQRKLPVLVCFFSDSFTKGNFDIYSPEYFMDTTEVLVVIVQFRLGPFGFLNLGLEECPGNQGLWDQLLALEWIRDNIHAFGGDNSNVTLVGHGSGSICVSYHLVSPQTTGLFHRAILMSGTFISPYFWQNYDSTKIAQLFMEELETEDLEELQDKNQVEILEKANFMGDLNDDIPNPWVPCVDKNIKDCFLPDHPMKLDLKKMPIIIGSIQDEGKLFKKVL